MAAKKTPHMWLGHSLHPVPICDDAPKTVRESAYVEETISKFLSEYALRAGMSRSHAIRRLVILGAISEGYAFNRGLWVHDPDDGSES
jgi:hypothetical protein